MPNEGKADRAQEEKGRVQLDLTIEQAALLREGLMNLADQDAGRKWLSLHEQTLGALTDSTQAGLSRTSAGRKHDAR